MDAVRGETQLSDNVLSVIRLSAMMMSLILAMVSCVVTVTGLSGRKCFPYALSRMKVHPPVMLPPCLHESLWVLALMTDVADDRTLADVVHFNQRPLMLNV